MDKQIFEKYLGEVRCGSKRVVEVCAELGISKQTWYNWVKKGTCEPKQGGRKKKEEVEPVIKRERGRPKKVVESVPEIDWERVLEEEKREQAEWLRKLDKANEVMTDFLNKTFPRLWCKLRFEHVDASAYWYSFELVNDDRRQTWCVRHHEVLPEQIG